MNKKQSLLEEEEQEEQNEQDKLEHLLKDMVLYKEVKDLGQ
jgi:hypothetical protein